MKKFKVPCSWEVYGVLEINAKTAKEAILKAEKIQDECPLPEGHYIDGSFKLDHDFNEEYVNLLSEERSRKKKRFKY